MIERRACLAAPSPKLATPNETTLNRGVCGARLPRYDASSQQYKCHKADAGKSNKAPPAPNQADLEARRKCVGRVGGS